MIFDRFRKRKSSSVAATQKKYPELYEEEEVERLEAYIVEKYGGFETVFHEIVSPDIHVDIALIPPEGSRDYYTLITMGMGAHKMNVPPELAEYRLDRAELIIYLPKDWELDKDDEIWYWPIRWLKILARLPIEQDTWLGFGHTVPSGDPLAENVMFNCVLLIDDDSAVTLSGDKHVNFYTLVPLYDDEMQYKLKNGAEALLSLFEKEGISYPPVVDRQRKSVCMGRPT